MKSVITTTPLLHIGRESSFVILATAPRKGIVLYAGNSPYEVGHDMGQNMCEAFNTEVWQPFTGTLKLAND